MMGRRAYIAGPMTGYEEWNFPAFAKATAYVRSLGWEAVSPAEHDLEMGFDPASKVMLAGYTREDALRWDFGVLIDPRTTDIVMLPGWLNSEGAKAEWCVAKALNLKVSHYEAGGLWP